MIINLVLVILVSSSNKPQNLVTLASSKGASTSSKTHIGEGFTKKTAKIKDKAVSACSPPDNNVIVHFHEQAPRLQRPVLKQQLGNPSRLI